MEIRTTSTAPAIAAAKLKITIGNGMYKNSTVIDGTTSVQPNGGLGDSYSVTGAKGNKVSAITTVVDTNPNSNLATATYELCDMKGNQLLKIDKSYDSPTDNGVTTFILVLSFV